MDPNSNIPWQGNMKKHSSGNPLMKYLNEKLKTDILLALKKYNPKTILDVGCGEGFITSKLAKKFKEAKILGIDIEQEYIDYAKFFNAYNNVEYEINSIDTLPKIKYDLIVATEVLEHLENPKDAIEKLKAVSETSGIVLITIPNEPYFRLGNLCALKYIKNLGNTPGHLHNWTKGQISNLLKMMKLDFEIKTSTFWNIIIIK